MDAYTDWPRDPAGGAARAPEDLETILEDALLTHDHPTLAGLFAPGAVFQPWDGPGTRGAAEIAAATQATWPGPGAFVAAIERIARARDIALIVSANGIGVARRGPDGAWRYLILLAQPASDPERSRP